MTVLATLPDSMRMRLIPVDKPMTWQHLSCKSFDRRIGRCVSVILTFAGRTGSSPSQGQQRKIHLDDDQPPCSLPQSPDYSGVVLIDLNPTPSPVDYREALRIAEGEARARLRDPMMLSWYDRDRNFESPQHASECHAASAVPGYVDYGVYHGASLRIDIEQGRFVFFYLDAGSF